MGFIKFKKFCSCKDTVKRIKRQAIDWEKIFTNHISDKELVSKKCKELTKPNNKKITQFLKWVKGLNTSQKKI